MKITKKKRKLIIKITKKKRKLIIKITKKKRKLIIKITKKKYDETEKKGIQCAYICGHSKPYLGRREMWSLKPHIGQREKGPDIKPHSRL
jgi:hypothetical protein